MQGHAREVVVAPAALATVVDGTALRAALPTAGDRPGRDNIHDQAGRVEVEAANGEVLEAEEGSEYCGRAQGGAWAEDALNTRSLVSSPCASTTGRETADFGTQSPEPRRSCLTRLPLNVQESLIWEIVIW